LPTSGVGIFCLSVGYNPRADVSTLGNNILFKLRVNEFKKRALSGWSTPAAEQNIRIVVPESEAESNQRLGQGCGARSKKGFTIGITTPTWREQFSPTIGEAVSDSSVSGLTET
jgi:hypothetical protein